MFVRLIVGNGGRAGGDERGRGERGGLWAGLSDVSRWGFAGDGMGVLRGFGKWWYDPMYLPSLIIEGERISERREKRKD